MILDEIKLHLKAGKGGMGCSSFSRRSAGKPIPSGGNGGKGGSIFLKTSPHLYDLSKFRSRRNYSAADGKAGLPNNKTGKSSPDVTLEVPSGTLVRETSGEVIIDMTAVDIFEIATGGKGGRGNYKRENASDGDDGQMREVVLDYRIPNDAALLGLPNAGKTSLFNELTQKTHKVAEYPFTTTSCIWAPVEYEYKRFILMDMPALYEHSHTGGGAGNAFLKHLYRTKILIFVVPSDAKETEHIACIEHQLKCFNPALLAEKKIFYLRSKTDTIKAKEKKGFFSVSSLAQYNTELLKEKIINMLHL